MLSEAERKEASGRAREPFRLLSFLLFLLVASIACQLCLSHELPSLSKLLDSTGLGAQQSGLSKQQKFLIGLISGVYEIEDELHASERKLLNDVGQSKPDGKQKGTLQRMYNTHLINLNKLTGLSSLLKQEVDTTTKLAYQDQNQSQQLHQNQAA